MRLDWQLSALRCAAIAVGALALAGCASDSYLYDDDPGVYYRGSAGYPPYYSGCPRYYGYPGYYAPPRYYGYSPYPPRVVYYDHDHRDDRDHPPQDHDGRPDRRPQGEGPATPPPQWRTPPRGVSPEGPGAPPQARPTPDDRGAAPNKRRPPAAPRPDEPPRGMRALRVKQPDDPDRKSEARKELD
jgi:hypothetical protein